MDSEKVKEIKECLDYCKDGDCEICLRLRNVLLQEVDCRFVLINDAITLINELESENERLKILVDIANEREYRKKFNDEWRKEYQKELDKQGNGHIAGHPDFDLVYKLYFEQKDRIAELEKENGELKKHITEVEKGIINIARERNKKDELASKFIDSYNDSLKQFAEKVKEKALSHCKTINCYELKFIEETIDELLREYKND